MSAEGADEVRSSPSTSRPLVSDALGPDGPVIGHELDFLP
jgi:hypothetical protein